MKYIQSISIFSVLIGVMLSSMNATTLNADAEDMNVREVEALLLKRMDGATQAQVHDLTQHLFQLCSEYEFNVSSVLAVILAESGFNPKAVSPVGAVGLMQLMPRTAQYIAQRMEIQTYRNAKDLYDPKINLTLGVAYLSFLRDRFAKSHHYLAAYNMGPSKYNRWMRKRQDHPESVKKYVKHIHNGVYQIRKEAQSLAYAQAG